MLRGGVSDKLGNGYEAQWSLLQALRVLRGDAASIKIEPVAVGAGFEFLVEVAAGCEWHQSKINGARGAWTLPALNREGFLRRVSEKAKQDAGARFVFVSTDPAPDLKIFCGKAVLAEDHENFIGMFDDAPTQKAKLPSLAGFMGIQAEECWDVLRRLRVEIVSDYSLREHVLSDFRYLVAGGNAEAAANAIKAILENNLTKTLTTQRLRDELANAGYRLRDAMLDPSMRQRLQDQNDAYAESYGALGFEGAELSRLASVEIVDALRDDTINLVAVTGVAGAGKSGVLRLAARSLAGEAEYLLLRIDRVLDIGTTDALGQHIFGREESPCRTLSQLAGDRVAVLFIDQLDAVSEVAGRQAKARELVFALRRDAGRLPNVKVVLSCREYDFKNDRRFQSMTQTENTRKIAVDLLDYEGEVVPYLQRLDLEVAREPAQRDLLRLPLNLMLYAELRKQGVADLDRATTTTGLFELLLREKGRELRDRVSWTVEEAIGTVARSMSDDEKLDAPVHCLDGYHDASDLLVSMHLLTRDGSRVRFFHESLFDYAFGRDFVRRRASLFEWLLSQEQVLFRRTQVRQVLDMLRASDDRGYLRELKALLSAPTVRPHIRHMVALWLAARPSPSKDELEVVVALDDVSSDPPHVVNHSFNGRAWAELLVSTGILQGWLRSANEARRMLALRLLDGASGESPGMVAEVLRAWWRDAPDARSVLIRWIPLFRMAASDEPLAELYADVVGETPADIFPDAALPGIADIGRWVHHGSHKAARLYSAWLARWFAVRGEGHPFKRTHGNERHWIGELAKKQPAEFAREVAPWLNEAFRRELANNTASPRWRSAFDLRDQSGEEHAFYEVLDFMRSSIRTVAAQDAPAARAILGSIDAIDHFAALHLHLEAVAANGSLHDLLRPLLKRPDLFEVGFDGADWKSAAEALAAALPHLGEAERDLVDDLLSRFQPELAFARQLLERGPDERGESEHRRTLLRVLASTGEDLRGVLTTIGTNRLRPAWRARLAELDRKFVGRDIPKPFKSRGGWVGSPIDVEHARRMTDEAWLTAIAKYNGPRERTGWREEGPVSGGDELARVMQHCTKESPQRYVNLALKFPEGTYIRYPLAVVEGVTESDAPAAVALAAAKVWLNGERLPGERDPLCRLVESKPTLISDGAVHDALFELARHGDESADSVIDDDNHDTADATLDEVLSFPDKVAFRGMVSERGSAIHAISAGLSETEERVDDAEKLIRELAGTSISREIRCCLRYLAHTVAAIDPERGLALIDDLTKKDAWSLGTRGGIQLVVWSLFNRRDTGERLLRRVLDAGDERLRVTGLWMLAIFAFRDDAAAEEFEALWPGSPIARRIAARVAVDHSERADKPLRERAVDWLHRLFNDEDEIVRKATARAGRCLSGPDHAARAALAETLAGSAAFRTAPDHLLHALEERAGEFPRAVIASAKAYFQAEREETLSVAAKRDMAIHWVSRMVLAAYRTLENDPAFRADALDLVDELVLRDQIGTRNELDSFDMR